MSKNDAKKSRKSANAAVRKTALKALKDAPIMREAWIAAIEAGAAAAIDVIRKASDAELVNLVETKPEKKTKKPAKAPEKPEATPAQPAA